MSVLLVYPVVLAVIGVVAFVVTRRSRATQRAIPPWEAWKRGAYYSDVQAGRRNRRTRALLGGLLGVVIAVPMMILAGFSGTAKRATQRR
ncbi:hypothetical protein [Rhodococcus opacus]|uniref:hypothetical protein n=1 Tax=Rhodococcus opacus TaxID=37919 RepID=UPI000AB18959|nr:hypothetical protein [Rhodococcus opacus]UDH01737.1 hypothetical protein K2Z90_008262 [Rhodococcus opacus PD630]